MTTGKIVKILSSGWSFAGSQLDLVELEMTTESKSGRKRKRTEYGVYIGRVCFCRYPCMAQAVNIYRLFGGTYPKEVKKNGRKK